MSTIYHLTVSASNRVEYDCADLGEVADKLRGCNGRAVLDHDGPSGRELASGTVGQVLEDVESAIEAGFWAEPDGLEIPA